jgi:hypothetical protein
MWVFIRPGVVRRSNEERLRPTKNSVQFILLMGSIRFRARSRQCAAALKARRCAACGMHCGAHMPWGE